MTSPHPQVTYWAISIFSSRTFWLNAAAFAVAALSAAEVVMIVPPAYLSIYSAVLAVANIGLRSVTVRPVAFIAPGETKPVVVQKIDPPTKPVTD